MSELSRLASGRGPKIPVHQLGYAMVRYFTQHSVYPVSLRETTLYLASLALRSSGGDRSDIDEANLALDIEEMNTFYTGMASTNARQEFLHQVNALPIGLEGAAISDEEYDFYMGIDPLGARYVYDEDGEMVGVVGA